MSGAILASLGAALSGLGTAIVDAWTRDPSRLRERATHARARAQHALQRSRMVPRDGHKRRRLLALSMKLHERADQLEARAIAAEGMRR